MAKGKWKTVSHMETEPEKYKFEGHAFIPLARMPWPHCKRCGLVALKNDVTRKAIKLGCNYDMHSSFKKRK